jgi:hypothetical protein
MVNRAEVVEAENANSLLARQQSVSPTELRAASRSEADARKGKPQRASRRSGWMKR